MSPETRLNGLRKTWFRRQHAASAAEAAADFAGLTARLEVAPFQSRIKMRVFLQPVKGVPFQNKIGTRAFPEAAEMCLKVSAIFLAFFLLAAAFAPAANAADVSSQQRYVVTNDNVNGPNSATVYLAGDTASAPTLTLVATIPTGGAGSQYGYFAALLQVLVKVGSDECAFVSDGGSNDIAGINLSTLAVTGNYKGSSTDSAFQGIGLVAHNGFLYAAFTGSDTIATFSIGSGCTLTFMGDVPSVGLGTSSMDQIAANGNILVVIYSDNSIASFSISGRLPVANGDLQYTTGYSEFANEVGAVDITKDGHYALFGGFYANLTIEVSDISSGKLTPTVVYGGKSKNLGPGFGANNIWLGPEEEYLYVSNTFSGQVTALRFNTSTGAVLPFASGGCISTTLNGYLTTGFFPSSLATAGPIERAGLTLWVAEYGFNTSSGIGILHRSTAGGHCVLTESPDSPVSDAATKTLTSISPYPPRPF